MILARAGYSSQVGVMSGRRPGCPHASATYCLHGPQVSTDPAGASAASRYRRNVAVALPMLFLFTMALYRPVKYVAKSLDLVQCHRNRKKICDI
jgi:hypothetical protein